MKLMTRRAVLLMSAIGVSGVFAQGQARRGQGGGCGPGGPRPEHLGASPLELGEPGIAWYGKLEDGLAEAKRMNRPILFMAAASQCGGVPGVF